MRALLGIVHQTILGAIRSKLFVSELILILAVPTLELSCKVPGKVVRRDEKGIGVCFENLSLKHKEAIQALSALHLSPAAVLQPDEAEEPSLELFG